MPASGKYLAGGYNKTLSLTGPVNAPSMRQFEVGAGEVKQIDAGQLCEITTPPYDTPKTAAGTTPPGGRAPAERVTPGLAWARKTSASTVLAAAPKHVPKVERRRCIRQVTFHSKMIKLFGLSNVTDLLGQKKLRRQ